MLTLADNPPAIYPENASLAELRGRWWVAHTLSRFEKVFARELARLGVSYFLPLVRRRTISTGRKRVTEVPLFPGYVFVCGSDEQRQAALRTNRLCGLLEAPDQDGLIGQLLDIKMLLDSGCGIIPQARLIRGRRCRVTGGALAGVEGVIDRAAGTDRLVVNVDMLGRGAAVEIDADLLEPLN